MLSADLAIFLAFIVAVALVVWHDRKNIKPTGIVLMRRTQRGRAWLYRTASRMPRVWKLFSTIGVVVAIPAMIYISYFLVHTVIQLASGEPAGAVKLVLPWSGFEDRPGIFFMPWYFWVIGIAVVIIPHELSHGLACRIAKIRIKSLGWMLLLFLPGAFVDPDEKQLKKASRLAKLRVYAAGSFANFVVAVICLAISTGLLAALFIPNGIIPAGVIADTPAAAANISGALLSIDGVQINSQEDLVSVMRQTPVGSTIALETTTGNYSIATVTHPELNQSYLGVAGPYQTRYALKSGIETNGFGGVANFFSELFQWLWLMSLGIGMFNLLPIKPLDGGLVFEEIVGKFIRKNAARVIVVGVSLLMVAVVILNVVGPALIG